MEEEWTEIADLELRKRVQNRLSQRKHRRKIREQAGMLSEAGQRASLTAPGQTVSVINGHPDFPPSSSALLEGPRQAFGQKTQWNIGRQQQVDGAGLDNGFDDLELENFPADDFASTGFAGLPWNLGASSNGTRTVVDTCVGAPPASQKPSETWNNFRPAIAPPGRDPGNQHVSREPVQPGFIPPSAWHQPNMNAQFQPSTQEHQIGTGNMNSVASQATMQPVNRQWQRQSISGLSPITTSRPPASAQSGSAKSAKRTIAQEPEPHTDEVNHCSNCGCRKRQGNSPTSAVSVTSGSTTPTISSSSSFTVGQALTSPRITTKFSGSDVLREHGIDLAQLSSQAMRRQSVTRKAPCQSPVAPGPLWETSQRSSSGHQRRHSSHQPYTQEVFEVGESEYNMKYPEGRVTKVVVIYMQECSCR